MFWCVKSNLYHLYLIHIDSYTTIYRSTSPINSNIYINWRSKASPSSTLSLSVMNKCFLLGAHIISWWPIPLRSKYNIMDLPFFTGIFHTINQIIVFLISLIEEWRDKLTMANVADTTWIFFLVGCFLLC